MPYRLTGRVVLLLAVLLLLTPGMVLAKGLDKEELSNSRKDKIAALAKDIRDHPEDGDIAFSRSTALIEENHAQAYEALKTLYRDGSEKVKAKIIKALGVQREKVVDAAADYWVVLEQALGSGAKEVSQEVVTSLARLESEEIFDKLLGKLKAKDLSGAALDNIVEVLSRFETGQTATKTLGKRVEATAMLAQPQHKGRVLKALGDFLGEEFANQADAGKWWTGNQNKTITAILSEANRRKGDKYREEKAKAEKRRLEAVAERIERLQTVLKYNKDEAIKMFQAELQKPDAYPEVLEFAVKNLGQLQVSQALKAIRGQLDSKHAGCRIAAIEALGILKDREGLEEIAKKLSAERPDERRAAVDTVAVFEGDKVAAEKLIAALGKEGDRSVKKRIVEKLGAVGRSEALIPLIKTVADITPAGKFDKIRQNASTDYLTAVGDSVGSILRKSGPAPAAEHRDAAIEYLLAMLSVNEDQVKYHAITNLGKARAGKAVGVLVEILSNKEAGAGLRAHAAIALGEMPKLPETALEALLGNFKNKSEEVSNGCKSALRNIAGLNGSGRELDLDLLTGLGEKLTASKSYDLVCLLLTGLPESKDLKSKDKDALDKLNRLKSVLAGAHMQKNEFNAAIALLEKVVAHFEKEPGYREMLGDSYAGFNQVTKAIDEYQRAISMVEPAKAIKYWQKNADLIAKIQDGKEKAKRLDAALKLNPPEGIKAKLEEMRQQIAGDGQKVPKTP